MTAVVQVGRLRSGATFRPMTPLPIGLLYYPGVRCPQCGGQHFHVGRVTAECQRCDTALVLSTPSQEH